LQALETVVARITVVMPVFNEGDTIRSTLLEASQKIPRTYDNVVFAVSEDGSTDNTKDALVSMASEMPNLQVHLGPRRKGYPRAAKDAILGVDGRTEYILFMDSDGQYDPKDFGTLWREMKKSDADMVVGKRMNRAETPLRVFLSTGLRILEKIMFHTKQRDVTSAFRLMRVGPAQSVARGVKYSKYNFWLEFTAIASLRGYRMQEVPVVYRAREGTSRVYSGSKILKAAVQELTTIFSIWRDYHIRGIRRETGCQATATLPSP
jgi:glycosyltransferase involved in cell wall biosynthesis